MHFFEARFIDDEHDMIGIASKCTDLRLFCMPTLPSGKSLDNYLHIHVQPQYKKV
jgi:hypothetical protein